MADYFAWPRRARTIVRSCNHGPLGTRLVKRSSRRDSGDGGEEDRGREETETRIFSQSGLQCVPGVPSYITVPQKIPFTLLSRLSYLSSLLSLLFSRSFPLKSSHPPSPLIAPSVRACWRGETTHPSGRVTTSQAQTSHCSNLSRTQRVHDNEQQCSPPPHYAHTHRRDVSRVPPTHLSMSYTQIVW